MGVEPWGLRLAGGVTSAAIDAAVAAPKVLVPLGHACYPRLAVVWADSTYHHHDLNQWIATASPGTWRLEIVRRPQGAKGCVRLLKRWVVERTFAWLGRCRRHSRASERQTTSRESMLRVSAIHLRLTRLDPSPVYPPCRYGVAA